MGLSSKATSGTSNGTTNAPVKMVTASVLDAVLKKGDRGDYYSLKIQYTTTYTDGTVRVTEPTLGNPSVDLGEDDGETAGILKGLRMVAAGRAVLTETLNNLSPAGRKRFAHLLSAPANGTVTAKPPAGKPANGTASKAAAQAAALADMQDADADSDAALFSDEA